MHWSRLNEYFSSVCLYVEFALMGGGRSKETHHYHHSVEYRPDPATLQKYEEQDKELKKQKNLIEDLQKKVQENEIRNPDDYKEQCEKSFGTLCALATNIPATNVLQYRDLVCVAFYGQTSTGKSSLINLIMGQKVAEVGPGETTMNITPYIAPHGRLCLYDYPGNNDEISYYSGDILSLAKSMDLSCVLFTSTIKTNLKYCRLLTSMKCSFVALLTQTDNPKWTEESIGKVKQQTNDLLKDFQGYKGCFAVSSEGNGLLHDTPQFMVFLTHLHHTKFGSSLPLT